jgi:methionyl-tRNA formyltransferase
MKSTSTKIVFFGTEDFSLATLTGLIEADYSIAAVVTRPDSKKGRGQRLTPPAVKILATRHNIPVWQPARLKDITDDIKSLGKTIGILVSFGKIIPQNTIDLFTPGIINVHPSLLPKYRGPSPIESAILNGDETTGVSIMQLSAEMDAGPVYAAKTYALKGTETRPELYQTLATIGTDLLLETLPRILDSSLHPLPQNNQEATYCQLLQKENGVLQPEKIPAAQAERQVRAYLNYPKTRYSIFNQQVIITKARVSNEYETPLDILCQDGAFLSIDELIAPSGRVMSGEAFLHGYAGA